MEITDINSKFAKHTLQCSKRNKSIINPKIIILAYIIECHKKNKSKTHTLPLKTTYKF